MIFSQKILLKPTLEQSEALERCCKISDDVFNLGLDWCKKEGFLSHSELKSYVNSLKVVDLNNVDAVKVNKSVPSVALSEVRRVLKNKDQKTWKCIKSRNNSKRFKLFYGQFQIDEKTLRVNRVGDIDMYRPLRFTGEVLHATFSKKRKDWYVSVSVRVKGINKKKNKCFLLYLNSSDAIISPGERLRVGMNVKTALPYLDKSPLTTAIAKEEKRLERYKRRLRRSSEGSRNNKKYKKTVAKTQNRIIRCKTERLRRISKFITTSYGVVHLSYKKDSELSSQFKKQLKSKLRFVKGSLGRQTREQIGRMLELKKTSDLERARIKRSEEKKLEMERKAKEEFLTAEERFKSLINQGKDEPKNPYKYSIHDNFPTTEFVAEVFEKYDQRVREEERAKSRPFLELEPGVFPTVEQFDKILTLRDQYEKRLLRTTGSSPGIACGDSVNGLFKSLDQQIKDGSFELKTGSLKQEQLVIKEPDENELIAKRLRERNLAEYRARERKRVLEEEYGPGARNREELY